MSEEPTPLAGPDLSLGVAISGIADGGMLLGHAGGEPVLLVRRGDEFFAIGAACTHYHGPLAEGLVVGDTIRCPWHHACFDLSNGDAVRAPALSALNTWRVERDGSRIYVREKNAPQIRKITSAPGKIVIVGGGAAGFAAAEMLRRRDFSGSIVMLSSDPDGPVDRPNLSKDYLAGSAPLDWVP